MTSAWQIGFMGNHESNPTTSGKNNFEKKKEKDHIVT